MNQAILRDDVQKFIDSNIDVDITKIILKGSPFSDLSVQELANQIIAKNKSKKKLPTWFSTDKIYFPERISIEQTSSEITADYKSKLLNGNSIIDITGGFGVDCYYFSKLFKKVIHCEINNELSKIVAHNYKKLKVNNIEVLPTNGFDYLKQTDQTFDCIYVDPSRRDDVKGKVFLLKDCQPYIPPKIDFFFTKANQILVKLSPILDISNTIQQIKNVKEIHIVAVNNEVKEQLFLLEKNYVDDINIKTINIQKNDTQTFDFSFNNNATSKYSKILNYLYEPNVAILKSGGFHEISNKLNIFKIHEHSHLYTSENQIDFPGRSFIVNNVVEYDKKKIKKVFSEKKANITTRNFPKTVARVRKELKLKDGGNYYLFCTKDMKNRLKIAICSKI